MSDTTSPAPPQRRSPTVAILCFLVAILEGYDLQVVSPAGPALQKVLHLKPEMLGLLFSSSLAGLAIGAILGGWLGDRYGRKRVLVWSVFVMGLFTLATSVASTFEVIVATRVFAGIGLGAAMPTLIALMTELAGGKKTTSAVSTMITGQPLGGIIAGVVGFGLAAKFGWQGLFIAGGAATMLIVPLLHWFLPETQPSASASAPARMSVSTALVGEGRTASTLSLWALFIVTLALLSALLNWTPLLVVGQGLPRGVGINAIIAVNVGGIIGGLVISRIIDRFGVRIPMLVLYVAMAASLYLFSNTQSVTSILLAAGLVGFCVLGAQFTLYGVAPRLYPFAGRASGVGWAVAMGRIGSVVGPLVLGGLLGGGASPSQAMLVMAPVALVAGAILLALTIFGKGALSGSGAARPAVIPAE